MASSLGRIDLRRTTTDGAKVGKEQLHNDLVAGSLILQEQLQRRRNTCIIDPRASKWLRYWDVVVALCLVYTALVTPFEVAYLPPPATATNLLFLINRVIDCIFILDMLKEFLVMYEVDVSKKLDPSAVVKEVAGTKKRKRQLSTLVADPWKIAKHYLSTWFIIDLISVLTSLIDFVSLGATSEISYIEEIGEIHNDVNGDKIDNLAGVAATVNRLRLLKVLRVLRLVKLVRLLKSSRIFERWRAMISLDFSTQTVIYCLCMYLLCGHWFACILVLSGSFTHPLHSWKGAKGYCVDAKEFGGEAGLPWGHSWERESEHVQSMHPGYEVGMDGVYCVSPGELWVATYYWMIMLISGASGGDTDRGQMYMGEHIVFTGLVVASALLWSQIIASFCDVLSNLNPEHAAFRQRMDNLNRYCRANKFDSATRHRLREYLYRAKHVQVEESERELLGLMSPKLQGELALQVTGTWLTSVRFLQHVESACVIELALALSAAVYVPTERIDMNALYYLQRGTVVSQGQVLVGGDHWGKECILERDDLRANPARALSYVEVTRIHRDRLLEIIHQSVDTADGKHHFNKYPKALRKIKWEAVRLAATRSLLALARERGARPVELGAWGSAMRKMGSDDVTVEEIEQMRAENERELSKHQSRSLPKRGKSKRSNADGSAAGSPASPQASPQPGSSSGNGPKSFDVEAAKSTACVTANVVSAAAEPTAALSASIIAEQATATPANHASPSTHEHDNLQSEAPEEADSPTRCASQASNGGSSSSCGSPPRGSSPSPDGWRRSLTRQPTTPISFV